MTSARLRLRVTLALGLWAACSPVSLAASPADDRQEPAIPRCELGPYVGVAWNSPAGRRLGIIPDRDHLFVGVQLTATLLRRHRWALAYSPEVVPLLLISGNPKYETIRLPGGGDYVIGNGQGPVAGVGISPIGLQAQVRLASRWRAYGGGGAGAVWFTREVPVAYSRAFNYTFEIGGGVRWQYRPNATLRFGYKFHHLSNAYTAYQNPGLDAMVFLIGYDRALGSRR